VRNTVSSVQNRDKRITGVLFLKVTQAGSPAGELNTIGKWAWAQQDFDVLVGLYFYSERPGLAGRGTRQNL